MKSPKTRLGRVALTAGATIVIVALAGFAWVGVRGWMAQQELEQAQALTTELKSAVDAGDLQSALATTEEVRAHAAAAAGLTSDFVWRGAEALPFAGANLAAVRVVASELETVLSDTALPVMGSARELSDGLRRPEGGLDTTVLAAQQDTLADADAALRASAARLDEIDVKPLLPPIRNAVSQLDSVVDQLTPVAGALNDASQLVPPILGQDGPQTILVMLQNNAELRTGGGISGTFIELRADAGRLTLVSTADSSEFKRSTVPVVPIPESTLALYGDQVGRFVQNATMPADFELTAELISTWWKGRAGAAPDTIVSVDPLVLRSLLAVTGPISTSQGSLSSDLLVQRLLVDPYMSLDQNAQTEVFREAASAVFSRLAEFDIDPIRFASALADPVSDGRISVWSADTAVQDILAGTALAGPAARQRAAGADAFAVYLNDATGGKMDSLLDVAVATGTAQCRPDDRSDMVVSVTLTSRVAADAAQTLPVSMSGGGNFGARIGDIATNVSVSAPEGSYFGGATRDGELLPSVDVEDVGFPVTATRVVLAPGESVTVDFRFVSAGTAAVAPEVIHTPLLTPVELSQTDVACGEG